MIHVRLTVLQSISPRKTTIQQKLARIRPYRHDDIDSIYEIKKLRYFNIFKFKLSKKNLIFLFYPNRLLKILNCTKSFRFFFEFCDFLCIHWKPLRCRQESIIISNRKFPGILATGHADISLTRSYGQRLGFFSSSVHQLQ